MNATRRLTSLVAASLLLTACATAPVTTLQGTDKLQNIDQSYVAAVEEATRKASVRVYWINPPLDTDSDD